MKKNCVICGMEFHPITSTNKTCSDACSKILRKITVNAGKKRRGRSKSCSICGGFFLTVSPSVKTCSKQCSDELRKQSSRNAVNIKNARVSAMNLWASGVFKRTRVTKQCEFCGNDFTVLAGLRWKKTCSKDCADQLRSAKVNTPAHNAAAAASRAKRFKDDPAYRDKVIRRARKSVLFAQSAARNHPGLRSGVDNIHAKHWSVRSPRGLVYQFKNALEFFRTHPDLFDPDDIRLRKGGDCRASSGFSSIRPGSRASDTIGSWKGWTWYSIYERRFNDGGDLLERNSNVNQLPPK